MKKYVLSAFAVMLTLAFGACSNGNGSEAERNRTDLEMSGMRGSVKSVTTLEINVESGDTTRVVQQYNEDGNQTLFLLTYDDYRSRTESSFADGRVTSVRNYQTPDGCDSMFVVFENVMTYNAEGKLDRTVQKLYNIDDPSNRAKFVDEIASSYYYSEGSLDSISYVNSLGHVMSINNEMLDNNNSTKQTLMRANGIFSGRNDYYETSIYDADHRLTEIQHPGYVEKTRYSDKGDISEISITEGTQTVRYVMEFETFDDKDNWTTQKKYVVMPDDSKHLVQQYVRTLEYWK